LIGQLQQLVVQRWDISNFHSIQLKTSYRNLGVDETVEDVLSDNQKISFIKLYGNEKDDKWQLTKDIGWIYDYCSAIRRREHTEMNLFKFIKNLSDNFSYSIRSDVWRALSKLNT
jgi:hypothetical protein